MEDSRPASDRSTADEPQFVNYLPGMPQLSREPGRIERFLTRLFRRRGGLRVVYRRD